MRCGGGARVERRGGFVCDLQGVGGAVWPGEGVGVARAESPGASSTWRLVTITTLS